MTLPMAPALEGLAIATDFTLRLCDRLRQMGVDVGIQQSAACLRAVLLNGVLEAEELKRLCRITLVNRRQDFWALQQAFDQVLKDYLDSNGRAEDDAGDKKRSEIRQGRQPASARNDGRSDRNRPEFGKPYRQFTEDRVTLPLRADSVLMQGYSAGEVDNHKDFRFVSKVEMPAMLSELEKIAKKHVTVARRKFRKANRRRGRVDLRASIRLTAKSDGEILDWRFKRRRPKRARFVVVADVSGSMEVYCTFLLNFLHNLNSSRHMKLETFVFSTRLERVTRELRTRNFREMLGKIATTFSAWSGGTKIGAAIETLNDTYEGIVTPKTCVIIMSDGWDTGDMALLDREMDRLRRHARSIVWINPLKGDAGYQPLAQGMATALPYCDHVLAGHSLDSLDQFARMIEN
jgi:uncharacterized protein with von Willebrand factor type A (vWA) domain